MNEKKLEQNKDNLKFVKEFINAIEPGDKIGGTFIAVISQFLGISLEKCANFEEKNESMRMSDLCFLQAKALEKCIEDLKKSAQVLIAMQQIKEEVFA